MTIQGGTERLASIGSSKYWRGDGLARAGYHGVVLVCGHLVRAHGATVSSGADGSRVECFSAGEWSRSERGIPVQSISTARTTAGPGIRRWTNSVTCPRN